LIISHIGSSSLTQSFGKVQWNREKYRFYPTTELQKQSNGDGNFGATLKLNGCCTTEKLSVGSQKQFNNDLKAKANFLTDSLLSFNGNDAPGLFEKWYIY
jgi:hypothetical protein